MRRPLLLLGILSFLMPVGAAGSDIKVENTVFMVRDSEEAMHVTFDLSWKAGWRNAKNHDAAWVIVKLIHRTWGTQHVPLTLAQIESSENYAIHVSKDKVGAFIVPTKEHRGDINWRVKLNLDRAVKPDSQDDYSILVTAIEMVRIPAGSHWIGDQSQDGIENRGSFFISSANGKPAGLHRVTSEKEIPVGKNRGELFYNTDRNQYRGDQKGPIPASFPKGTEPFYIMKYEVSQGQYAEFLNSLSDDATFERFRFGGRSYFKKRGSILIQDGRYVAVKPHEPLNFVTWDDQCAYADWAGLRPMTELEFSKAARGSVKPSAGEFPWGTSSIDKLQRFVHPEHGISMSGSWNERMLSDQNRDVFGASFYWVMDLSGNVWERVISVGSPDGRAFTGSHGDGNLGERVRATNEDWPHTYAGKAGHGYRGGGFYDQGRTAGEFNPWSPVGYRPFGGWAGAYPHRAYGFRAVRSQSPTP